MSDYPQLLPTACAIALLVAITVGVLGAARIDSWWAAATAVLRGTLQLAALSLILSRVITSPVWVAVALCVMFTVAVITSTGRIGWSVRTFAAVTGAMFAGVVLSLVIVFGTGSLDLTARYTLAIGGILIGGAMTIATLTARRPNQATADRWDEIEAWLALGASTRQATAGIRRSAIREALIPATDQTRTTGLVTLPGAFVGAIFGGLDPLDAGRFQIIVLAAILATAAVTALSVASGLSTRGPRTGPRASTRDMMKRDAHT